MNITHLFVGIIVLIYVLGGFINFDNFILFKDSSFYIYQFLTYSFVHANFEHLLFNSIALLQIGYFSESESNKSFLLKWIIFSIGSGLFSYIFEPNPVLGASGVIMGMFAYYYMKYKNHYNMQGVLVLVVINVLMGFLPGISLWGHLGGAITGFLYYIVVARSLSLSKTTKQSSMMK